MQLKTSMRIDHLAIWVKDLEKMKDFYHDYFGASFNEKYENFNKGFSSYFLEFGLGMARIELMHQKNSNLLEKTTNKQGMAHFAFGLGSEEMVIAMTEKLRTNGIEIIGEPRTTGDGYFESMVLDPEGNILELTV